MAIVMTEQSAQNMEYVRRLLKQKQPRFAAALELSARLVEGEARSAGVQEGCVRHCLYGGFTRDFATADPVPWAWLHNLTSRPGSGSE